MDRGITINRRILNEAGDPVTSAAVGDVLTVELTVTAPNDLHYVIIEDYYPTGADAVNSAS